MSSMSGDTTPVSFTESTRGAVTAAPWPRDAAATTKTAASAATLRRRAVSRTRTGTHAGSARACGMLARERRAPGLGVFEPAARVVDHDARAARDLAARHELAQRRERGA